MSAMRIDVIVVVGILVLGVACAKREVVVPLVFEPRTEEADSFGMVVRVYDGETMKSLPGIAVQVWGSSVHSMTDDRGLCQLLWLRPGRYTLTVDNPNYFRARRLVIFDPRHASNRFDIRLQHRKFDFQ